MKKQKSSIHLSDRPITEYDSDAFNVQEKFVNKIYDFITDTSILPLTIGITGEWGIGKSSIINLLKKKLEEGKNNIIIAFEPLLEGKAAILDLITLFILQLQQQITKNSTFNKINEILQGIIGSLKMKAFLQCDIPYFLTAGIEVKTADREESKLLLSEQLAELSKSLETQKK